MVPSHPRRPNAADAAQVLRAMTVEVGVISVIERTRGGAVGEAGHALSIDTVLQTAVTVVLGGEVAVAAASIATSGTMNVVVVGESLGGTLTIVLVVGILGPLSQYERRRHRHSLPEYRPVNGLVKRNRMGMLRVGRSKRETRRRRKEGTLRRIIILQAEYVFSLSVFTPLLCMQTNLVFPLGLMQQESTSAERAEMERIESELREKMLRQKVLKTRKNSKSGTDSVDR